MSDAETRGNDVRPFNARSLVLSVLLGLPEPRLSTAAMMRLAELFEIAPGTVRTALSRMAATGELATTRGDYELRGRLLERKSAQDIGRRPPPAVWDGSWWIVAVTVASRGIAERREFRTRMANGRMGELRPDTWLRPANGPDPHVAGDAVALRGPMAGSDPVALTRRLWDLDAIASRCVELAQRLEIGAAQLSMDSTAALPSGMLLAADVVRFLREEPYLPPSLCPPDWPIDELRRRYAAFDRAYGRTLRRAIGAP